MPPIVPKVIRGGPRKGPTFKPPRSTGQPKPKQSKGDNGYRRRSAPSKGTSNFESDDDDDESTQEQEEEEEEDEGEDDAATRNEASSSGASPPPTVDNDPPPMIPPALLTTLIHHHFPNQTTRIGKDAMGVVGKYMETFVREAIARAAFERQQVLESAPRRTVGDDFLEVWCCQFTEMRI